MMYVLISRNWLFSRTARRVYLLCALFNLALLATRIGIVVAMPAAGVSSLSSTAALLVKGFFLLEIIGSAVLFVGMSYCWLGFDGSYKKKGLWIVLVKLCLITAPLYYFLAYRPKASREASLQEP
jgi:hypothetical protein